MIKKLLFTLAISSAVLVSCGDGAAPEVKLDTKDVKGTINAEGVSVGTTELHNADGVYEVPNVKFNDECRMQIVPTPRSYEDELSQLQNSIKNFDGEMKEEKKVDNGLLYHVKSEFMDKIEEGYNFIYYVKGNGVNYVIKGEGKTPFEPIAKKEDAEKAFEAAQTFKPAE